MAKSVKETQREESEDGRNWIEIDENIVKLNHRR